VGRIVAAVAVALAVAGAVVAYRLLTVPDVAVLADPVPRTTAFMRLYAREHGLAAAPTVEWTPAGDISPLLLCAIVRAEDDGFFRHHGIDWSALWAAARRTLSGPEVFGGSTITQQLARNLFLGPELTLRRKLREAVIALRLDRALGKERILVLYANVVEWGDGVFGVAAATRHWLGTTPEGTDAFAASFLVGLIPRPAEPLAGANLRRVTRVQRRVLLGLHASGLLDGPGLRRAYYGAVFLFRALERGRPLADALALARARMPGAPQVGYPPVIGDWRGIPLDQALARHCGDASWARWYPRLAGVDTRR
jgi:monofunctional biosynthetic peptidoglycan transglycosylase